jgi:hypothetical protein
MNVTLRCIFSYFEGSLTRRKILGHGASGFTSAQNEGVLRIFIALGRVYTREPWAQWQVR